MKKIKEFFKDVKKAISKVKWPTNNDIVKYSLTKILFVLFFSAFFLALDLIIAYVKVLVG